MDDQTTPRIERFFEALRDGFSKAPTPQVREHHLAAMKAAFVPGGEPSRAPRRPRRFVRRVAIFSAAGLLASGTALAATGTLPRPAQDAVAKVAHGIGLDLPHPTAVTNPRAVQNPGVGFANAKKAWNDCRKTGATTCGPKPKAQDFVHPTSSPAVTAHPNNGQGDEHRATPNPQATRTPHPGADDGGHPTPRATEAGGGGHDHGDAAETPEPTRTPDLSG
jgi:hypothetical protein